MFNPLKALREKRDELVTEYKADRVATKIARKGYRAEKRAQIVSEYKAKAKRDARAKVNAPTFSEKVRKGLKQIKARNEKRSRNESKSSSSGLGNSTYKNPFNLSR